MYILYINNNTTSTNVKQDRTTYHHNQIIAKCHKIVVNYIVAINCFIIIPIYVCNDGIFQIIFQLLYMIFLFGFWNCSVVFLWDSYFVLAKFRPLYIHHGPNADLDINK